MGSKLNVAKNYENNKHIYYLEIFCRRYTRICNQKNYIVFYSFNLLTIGTKLMIFEQVFHGNDFSKTVEQRDES